MIARLFDQPRKPRWYDLAFQYGVLVVGIIGLPLAYLVYENWPG